MDFPFNLLDRMNSRKENDSFRSLSLQNEFSDFSSNDYLGFARNTELFRKVQKELESHQPLNGSGGSRLLSGNFDFHEALEAQIASFFNTEAALLFNSGYDANIGLLSSVPQRGDQIFFDETSHASIRDGIRLSNAKSIKFEHNDLDDLEQRLTRVSSTAQRYVVVESIYSMDGDAAPIKELVDLAKNHDLKLIVDEAHSTGVYGSRGQGIVEDLNLTDSVFARVHTFGKALGCHGAAIAGSDQLKEYLVNYSRSFIYTTAPPLHSVLAIKHALLLLAKTEERSLLSNNIELFKTGIEKYGLQNRFIKSNSSIQSAVIASNKNVKLIAQQLISKKIRCKTYT